MEKKKNGATQNALEAAKEYVNRQIEIMRAAGSAPKLSPSDYEALVQQVAKVAR